MKTNHLFESLSLGKLHLKNRIVLAPMTRGRAGPERIPNEVMADYYHQRSTAGLLITEATVVSNQGIGWIDSPGIYTDEMVAGWRKVTARVKPADTPIFLQLWHCGRASHSDFHNGELPVSASAIKSCRFLPRPSSSTVITYTRRSAASLTKRRGHYQWMKSRQP
jgi:N-ethylmaleimide reductase